MNGQASPKARVGCLATIGIAVLLVSYRVTASFNPFAVYASGSIWAEVVVSLLAFLAAALLMGLLTEWLMRKSVEVGAHRPAEDVICPGCGFPLIQYFSSHGVPIRCPECAVFWHNGPACYNKGMPKAKIVIPTYPCPRCRSKAARNEDLFDGGA
jgi:hypothetical protein